MCQAIIKLTKLHLIVFYFWQHRTQMTDLFLMREEKVEGESGLWTSLGKERPADWGGETAGERRFRRKLGRADGAVEESEGQVP
jgi:hypothetical protein